MTTKQQKKKESGGLAPELVKIEKLSPDPANVRKHSGRNIEAIKASLRRFGQQKPIVVNGDGVVIAGNGTLEAARELGWDRIDIVRTKLCGADAIAFGIADNRTSELADWDEDALTKVLDSLPEDLQEVAGFNDEELAELLNINASDVNEDEVPPVPKDPITKTGDLWLFDAHWVCDDCGKRYGYQEGVDMKECPCG